MNDKEEAAYNRGFDQGFRACLDQMALTGLTPKSASATDSFIRAARRRLGMPPSHNE